MKKKIIIEMIGMPGSGKSFVQNLILKKLKKYKIKKKNFLKQTKFKKIINFILFTLNYPVFSFKNFYYIFFKLNQKNLRFLYYFLNEAALRISDNYSKQKIIVNDEGFFYRSLEYFTSLNNHQNFTDYLNNIPKIDILIFVNSSTENCLRRVFKRKNHNYKYSESEKKNFNIKIKLIKYIAKFIHENKKTKIIKLNNDNLDTKKINRLITTIKENYENITY